MSSYCSEIFHWKPPQLEGESEDPVISELNALARDIRTELVLAKEEEERLTECILDGLRKTEKTLGTSNFQRFFDQCSARVNTEFECSEAEARQLSNSLDTLSELAQNISKRVAALDLGKSRVVECLQHVSDLRDLGTCANGVQQAIRDENFEEAASHIHRFLTLDSIVFKMSDSQDVKDAGYSVKNCYDILRKAAVDLKQHIEQKFDVAKEKGDIATMDRLFKLFPLINEHQSGLKRYGSHICDNIVQLSEQNYKIMEAGGTDDNRKNVLFADTLTMLFEGIARLIEISQPVIISAYGQDRMLDLIEIIQPQCDKQSKRINPIELDLLLSEVTLMHTRAELFWRFLKRRLNRSTDLEKGRKEGKSSNEPKGDESTINDPLLNEQQEFESEESRKMYLEKMEKHREERDRKLDLVLNRSGLNTRMQELLGKYVLMEQYYMVNSVQKAISMDTSEDGALTSSLLDDVFFIVRKSIRRSISSSSIDCICAMLNNGVTILETEFFKYISAPIKSGYPSVGWTTEAYQTAQSAYTAVLQQSKVGGETAVTSGVEKQRNAFLIGLNNMRSAIDCISTLKVGLAEDFEKYLSQITPLESKKLENAVCQLDDFTKRLEQYANLGIVKLCDAAFRTKLKSGADEFLELPHILSDEELSDFEINDPFMSNFILQLDKQLIRFESLLVPENYKMLVSCCAGEVAQQLERVIFKCSFNRLGALFLDREFRELSSYLSSIASWNIREKCARLSNIIALLNSSSLDEAMQLLEQLNTSLSAAMLSQNDIKRTLCLREEFQRDQINAKIKKLKM
ncbi:Cog4 domain-containing protein [Meloidogyne graminicola]|uniref:Conserved oligomeric Golgi complex subunit 4 n=1 Tax=Meloidogyne graminicola TaxID=189291 RepID=A0A8S9ZM58_9BILA|nr:Cog4 domain-containing protein [Meloidogyne graminicola]